MMSSSDITRPVSSATENGGDPANKFSSSTNVVSELMKQKGQENGSLIIVTVLVCDLCQVFVR